MIFAISVVKAYLLSELLRILHATNLVNRICKMVSSQDVEFWQLRLKGSSQRWRQPEHSSEPLPRVDNSHILTWRSETCLDLAVVGPYFEASSLFHVTEA